MCRVKARFQFFRGAAEKARYLPAAKARSGGSVTSCWGLRTGASINVPELRGVFAISFKNTNEEGVRAAN
jgi:hypothetical protein